MGQHVPNEPRWSAAPCNNQPYAQGHKAGYCVARRMNVARFGTSWPIWDPDIGERLTWLAGHRGRRASVGVGVQRLGQWASRLLVTSARWARAMSAWESAGYTALARLNMEFMWAGSYSSPGPGFLRTVVPRGHRGLGRQLVCCTRTIQIRIYITLLHIQVNFKLI